MFSAVPCFDRVISVHHIVVDNIGDFKSLSVNKKCVIIVQVRKVSKDEKKYRKKEILSLLDAIG